MKPEYAGVPDGVITDSREFVRSLANGQPIGSRVPEVKRDDVSSINHQIESYARAGLYDCDCIRSNKRCKCQLQCI